MKIGESNLRHYYVSFLLLVVFAYNFEYRDGWKNGQAPGDDPAYVEAAYNHWQTGAALDRISWSPGYEKLLSPFVGIFGKEKGYKIWRFALFAAVSLLAYFTFSQMFGSVWFGVVMAFWSQLFLMPYASPSLQTLLCLMYLICFRLLTHKTKFLGVVFGLLLNGIFISGVVPFVFVSFGALCMVFCHRLVLSRRFFLQLLIGVAVFVSFLLYHSYDITKYPEEAVGRGRAGLYHQLSLYILSSGRSFPYLKPGEDDPSPGIDAYHRHLKAIDRYYLDRFGDHEYDLRQVRHDDRWPLFLLDWPWMMAKDPELMREYRDEVLRSFLDSAGYAFQIILPFSDYDINSTTFRRGVYLIPLMLLLMFPILLQRVQKKKATSSFALAWPSRLQVIFLLCCLSSLMPLMLTKPLPIYFPPLIPSYLMVIAILSLALLKVLEKPRMSKNIVRTFTRKISTVLGKIPLSRSGKNA